MKWDTHKTVISIVWCQCFSVLFYMKVYVCMSSWQENAVVIHSIVGWKSSIGKWSRVQASVVMQLGHVQILNFFKTVEDFGSNRYNCQRNSKIHWKSVNNLAILIQ